MPPSRLFAPILLFLSLLNSALTAAPPLYTLNINPTSLNIQTCNSALFSYSVSPNLSTLQPVPLVVSVESTDGSIFKVLDYNALLGRASWLWGTVNVPPGPYILSMSSKNTQQYVISGQSDPFVVRLASTNCLGPASSSVPQPPLTTTPNPTLTPTQPSSSVPNTPKPSSSNLSHPPPPHSSNSSIANLPTGISSAARPSAGLKAGVSVAAIAVVLAGAGALYLLLARYCRRSQQPPKTSRRYRPGYNDLGSRDDYYIDPKAPVDPLGRSFSGGFPIDGVVSHHSRPGRLDFPDLDEKSAQSTNPIGGASSNGATAGHSRVDSITAPTYRPPIVPPPITHNNVVLAGRSPSGSSTGHEEGTSLDSNGFESSTTITSAGVQPPRRAARKPVPTYGDSQVQWNSEERKHRDSANSQSNPSYASSLSDIPPHPTRPAPNTLNHKGSFGETKPMNHVLIPDMPLSQN